MPSTILGTDPAEEEEPAFQDSMLLLDDSLEIDNESSDDQQAVESMECDDSSPFSFENMDNNPLESESDEFSDSSSDCFSYIQGRNKRSRGMGRSRCSSRSRGTARRSQQG